MTTTIGPIKKSSRKGFSLIELLIALSIGSMALAGMYSLVVFMVKSTMSMGNYIEMNAQTRKALDTFGRDMRMVTQIYGDPDPSETYLMAEVTTNSGSDIIEYSYSNGVFKRISSTGTQILLEDIDDFEMKYFSLVDVATTKPEEIKKIQIDAVMLRNVQHIENTNHVISARFMMRNRAVSN